VTTALGRIWLVAGSMAAGAALPSLGLFSGALIAATGILALAPRRRPLLAIGGLCLAAAGLGIVATSGRSGSGVLEQLAERVPYCFVGGQVVEQIGALGTLVSVDDARCEESISLRNPGVVVADLPRADAGASLTGSGWLLPLENDDFDAQRRRLGAHSKLDLDEVELGEVNGLLSRMAARIRDGLRSATAGMDQRSSALLRGLVIGDVSGIDPSTEESLRRAGLSHLVAVSGGNVAIVVGAVLLICRRWSLPARLGAAGFALVAFVTVVGPEPSVLRAAVMGAIGLAAIAFGRRADPLHALGLALIVVIGVRPALVYSVGLHLSVAATAGIVLWTAPIRNRLPKIPAVVTMPLAATLAAQIAVAPLLSLTFGEVSVIAPLANLVAIPVVPLATVLGLAAGVFGSVLPPVGLLLAQIATPLAGWVVDVGDALGSKGWATMRVAPMTGWVLAVAVGTAAVLTMRKIDSSL
jgi:competence protein ComEC